MKSPMKNLFQWTVLALVLLFVPEQNSLVIFDSEPSDRYGEFYLTAENSVVIVAKNSQAEGVEWQIDQLYEAISVQGRRSRPLAFHGESHAPPHSISVIYIAASGKDLIDSRVVHSTSGSFFQPGPLIFLTRFDMFNLYFLSAILAGGLLGLGFWIAQLYEPTSLSMPDGEVR